MFSPLDYKLCEGRNMSILLITASLITAWIAKQGLNKYLLVSKWLNKWMDEQPSAETKVPASMFTFFSRYISIISSHHDLILTLSTRASDWKNISLLQ